MYRLEGSEKSDQKEKQIMNTKEIARLVFEEARKTHKIGVYVHKDFESFYNQFENEHVLTTEHFFVLMQMYKEKTPLRRVEWCRDKEEKESFNFLLSNGYIYQPYEEADIYLVSAKGEELIKEMKRQLGKA